MDYSDGTIFFDYPKAERAAEDMAVQSDAIERILLNLELELAGLRDSWIGDDRDVYSEVQAKWDNALSNIKVMMKSHSALLDEISLKYRRSEQSGTQRWQDVRVGGH